MHVGLGGNNSVTCGLIDCSKVCVLQSNGFFTLKWK